ncbi:hypothetical protein C0989_007713 [Termitomyces sp. Mn162]|nr:hypothetical protein C0989_007713 [Termitomyces sp. Mn162]
MWEMHRIRLHCIDKLTDMSMSPVERVVLAKNFHVPQWLHTGYKELVNRNETLSMSDSENIGYRSAVGVFQLREQRLRWDYDNYRYGHFRGGQKFALNSILQDELADEEAIFQTYAAAIDTTNPVPATNAAPTVGGVHVDSQTS